MACYGMAFAIAAAMAPVGDHGWPWWLLCWVLAWAAALGFGHALARWQAAAGIEMLADLLAEVELARHYGEQRENAERRPPADAEGRNEGGPGPS